MSRAGGPGDCGAGEAPQIGGGVRWLVGGVLVVLLLVELSVARSLSLTCDEGLDAAAGIHALTHGRVELFPERPPLARRLSGLVLYALGVREGPAAASTSLERPNPHYVYAQRLVFEDNARFTFAGAREGPDALVTAARLPFLVFPLLLAGTAFAWGKARFGPRGGLVALLLAATYPDVLGPGLLAVQDA